MFVESYDATGQAVLAACPLFYHMPDRDASEENTDADSRTRK